MPDRALSQVQNMPKYATRKAGELKVSSIKVEVFMAAEPKKWTLQLLIRLAKLNEEVAEKAEDNLTLNHYIFAEESTEHLSEFELSGNKDIEREDEEDNIFQKI
ncbi:unnamed protein product [Onchocerca ochengi]|uniref:Gag-pol polyprotein n=1 Tax=Onchocerca ochengi TaxID=42157 RepID=A0A182EG20_ONCOC|nr:unnamed protein product [Onchocerca ochengi]